MLRFYVSTMRGGKSAELLKKRFDLLAIGKRVEVLTSASDIRHGVGKVTSRLGLQCDANLFHANTEFSASNFADIDVLLIDEAQFLSQAQTRQIHRALSASEGLEVHCYGLRTDFKGNPFEGAVGLLTLADEICMLSTYCACGSMATMNQRIDSDGAPVRDGAILEIGGDDRYRPVCSPCFY